MQGAVAAVERDEGAVGVLVNNADAAADSRLGGTPEMVAATIERAISARKLQSRYTVSPSASLMIALRRLCPIRCGKLS